MFFMGGAFSFLSSFPLFSYGCLVCFSSFVSFSDYNIIVTKPYYLNT